ncbi:MAG: hypothetical protein ACUVQZ_09335 [Candidatus Caldatribacteriaceae bacterium]
MMKNVTPVVELRGVNKTFGGVVRALNDVNIAIYPKFILTKWWEL